MLRVLVADDHPVVRQGLRQLTSETPDIVVVDEVDNGDEVISKALATNCDVALLDISMPGKHWLDILSELKIQEPRLAVLVLSIHAEEHYALRALKAGAAGYLTKESTSDELVAAIRKVASGRKYVSSSLAEKLVAELAADNERDLHDILTNREYQVMGMIALGKTVSEIARELLLSVKTISTYRSRILEKMHMKTNAEITRYAIEYRLV